PGAQRFLEALDLILATGNHRASPRMALDFRVEVINQRRDSRLDKPAGCSNPLIISRGPIHVPLQFKIAAEWVGAVHEESSRGRIRPRPDWRSPAAANPAAGLPAGEFRHQ